jgi:hypothetical protein
MKTLLLLLTLTLASFGADVAGRWTGKAEAVMADGEKRVVPLLFVFKEEGGQITGSGGPESEASVPLQDVKLDGDKLTFRLNTGDTLANFTCVIDGDTMSGDASADHEGRKVTAKLSLKKAK